MSLVIAPIVEGHGDFFALPVLLRKIDPALQVKKPVRFPRNRLVKDEHLERAAKIAASNIVGRGAVLLVIDGDEDCAARLGPDLEERLARILPHHTCRVVLAVREFESWIVGGDREYGVSDSDSTGNLKGRIRRRYGVYSETADQARLVAQVDLRVLERCSRSFRRLLKVVRELSSDSPGPRPCPPSTDHV